jgi:hypothetical protein
VKRNENEYVTFSISDTRRIDEEMIHIKDKDTLLYAVYDNGKLI